MNKKVSMREQMPETAAFIDAMRNVFGKDAIDGQIKRGMRGEPMFWATENGHTIGTKVLPIKEESGDE
jgi:hypothetical protein